MSAMRNTVSVKLRILEMRELTYTVSSLATKGGEFCKNCQLVANKEEYILSNI